MTGDLYREAGTAQLVAEVRALRIEGAPAHVDIVVNNWGRPEGSDWESSDSTSWHGSYDVNVVSTARVTQAFLPEMRDARWGPRGLRVDGRGHPPRATASPESTRPRAGALPSVTVGLAKHLLGNGRHRELVSPG